VGSATSPKLGAIVTITGPRGVGAAGVRYDQRAMHGKSSPDVCVPERYRQSASTLSCLLWVVLYLSANCLTVPHRGWDGHWPGGRILEIRYETLLETTAPSSAIDAVCASYCILQRLGPPFMMVSLTPALSQRAREMRSALRHFHGNLAACYLLPATR